MRIPITDNAGDKIEVNLTEFNACIVSKNMKSKPDITVLNRREARKIGEVLIG